MAVMPLVGRQGGGAHER